MKKVLLILSIALCICLVLASCNLQGEQPQNDNTSDNTNLEQPENQNGDSQNQTDNTQNGGETPENPDDTTPETETEPIVVNVASLKGPTSIGLVKLMDDAAADTSSKYVYDFTIEAAADAINPKLIQGQFDMAALPANVASVLYNNTNGEIIVLNVNTLGVLYIVENGNTVNTVEDLRGKTIYASGKGNTPEYALNTMLSAYGLVPGKDVFIEFKSEHAECVTAITSEPDAVAMLPQPFVTTAQMADENIRIALDINKEWENATEKKLVTGVMVARKAFVEEHPEIVEDFLAKYETSADYANQNVTEAAALVEKYGIFAANVAEKAIPYCGITFVSGDEMKQILSDYLVTLNEQNPAAIGGKLPEDDFYYGTTQE